MLLCKIVAVFLISASIGILYRIPRSLLFYASAVGVVAWLIMYYTMIVGATVVLADFLASIVVGVMAEFLSRTLKKPATSTLPRRIQPRLVTTTPTWPTRLRRMRALQPLSVSQLTQRRNGSSPDSGLSWRITTLKSTRRR